ncbi:MAG: hypothetical protein RJA70_228 [Pseudomonadota bacterium]|jgi:hypothetical protein
MFPYGVALRPFLLFKSLCFSKLHSGSGSPSPEPLCPFWAPDAEGLGDAAAGLAPIGGKTVAVVLRTTLGE